MGEKDDIQVHFLGDKGRFTPELRARLEKAEDIEKVSEEIDKEIEKAPAPEVKEEARENLDSEEESF